MRDILIFSTADWDNPFWTNKQHMASLFARNGWRVLYVDSLGLRQPTLRSRDLFRIASRLWKAMPFPRIAGDKIWRASPLVLPFHSNAHIRALNANLLRLTIQWHMHCLGMQKPLIWTYNPVIAELCANLPNSGIVYHCVDDLRAAPRINAMAIEEGERLLGRVANICFATSPLLRERMSGLFHKSIYEPNVCDYEMFGKARGQLPEPQALKAIPHPRLIFVGALSQYKVDFELIGEAAARLPHVHWVLIGPVGEGEPHSAKPPQAPNIHLLGPVPYADLPSYMAHSDAAVLPAPHNAYTAAMFPMKFFEYLAAGLPVVSTNLPALREFSNLCFFADGPEDFVATLERVLAGERRDVAEIEAACRLNSWEERFARMQGELDALKEAGLVRSGMPHNAMRDVGSHVAAQEGSEQTHNYPSYIAERAKARHTGGEL